MSHIDPVTRFVAFLPDNDGHDHEELRHAIDHVHKLGLDTLKQSPFLLAAVTTSTGRSNGDCAMLDVFPGTAASSRFTDAPFDRAADKAQIHDIAEQSAQCYNLLTATDTDFTLESDALGLKPVHIARTRTGHILASRIADILAVFPDLAEPADTTALYELMTFWAPLAERTLHQKIKRTLPGGCYHWSTDSQLRQWRGRELQPASVDPHRLMDQTIEELRDTAGQSLQSKTASTAKPIIMALSGGFDSRYIAALCQDHDIPIRAITFGRRNTEEWHSARDIARALKLDLETIRYNTDIVFQHLDHHLEMMEGTSDLLTLSVMNLFQATTPPGSSLLHGFCGDIQAGNQVERYRATDYATRESLADATLKSYYASTQPDLLKVINPAVDLDEVREDMLASLRSDCPPYQAYLFWHAENRTRRCVASQFPLLGNHFDCVLPFYDRRLFDLWTALPPLALVDRNIYRRLLATYYPALARIPHPEEPASITPNLRSQLARYYRRFPKRMLARAIGDDRTRRLYLRLHRDSNIYALNKLSAPQQQAHMHKRIEALCPTLQETLGVELSPNYQTVLSKHLLALRGMYMAVEYARKQSQQS